MQHKHCYDSCYLYKARYGRLMNKDATSTSATAAVPAPSPALPASPASDRLAPELSGIQWVSRFPGSSATSTLAPSFRLAVESFIGAMLAAGMRVLLSSTYRPPARSYLMHWCWKIRHGADPATAPSMPGVDIEWVHPMPSSSLIAATQMVAAYGMNLLGTAPALRSLHNLGHAVDMDISWGGTVTVSDAAGRHVTITTAPRTGMNGELRKVGASYGVVKFVGGASDKAHWSLNGH
jgi:hypothetical protein